MTTRLSIVGGGVMGEAILACLISKGVYSPTSICVSDRQAQRCQLIAEKYGVEVTVDNAIAANQADVLLLAVKPQSFAEVSANLQNVSVPLVISILAGVTLADLESVFKGKAVIRAMPNTPAQVGAGVTAITVGSLVTDEQKKIAHEIFATVGEVIDLPEKLINAVTGLSGSGPAYVAVVIEALADGGVAAGLPRAIATQLAIQTVFGTAKLLIQTNLHPAQLKDQVTSPGGTTIAGIAQLEKAGVRSGLIEAVLAATQRAEYLGNK